MEMNEILERLPLHLRNIIIDQPYHSYTPQDHAVWRYIMRRNIDYLSEVAHESYLEGLHKTGISIDRIPHMYGMNRILKEIAWAAVAVDGFIPPAAFMEFQAYNVLVIAADIRSIDQIAYTPAPDIVHEAAGHAPIIADPEYAAYLQEFGKIGSKAFSSSFDFQQYKAIRHLSILKADPNSPAMDIEEAEKDLQRIEKEVHTDSEMAKIRNLHWWTVEYGLIGDLKKPKIYGAGLLSSIGESFSALQNNVAKIPYTVAAADVSFDITSRQPQLFVSPDFAHLTKVLNEFANTMALRKGGKEALEKAKASENLSTIVYSSGLQVSGILSSFKSIGDEAVYLSFSGPTALSYADQQLKEQGKKYHLKGFGSPIGMWKNYKRNPENISDEELESLGLIKDAVAEIQFSSGVQLNGILRNKVRKEGRLLLLSFSDCRVQFRDEILFQPEWGMFDMAVGARIVSAFSGLADPKAWGFAFPVPQEKTHKIMYDHRAMKLHQLYKDVTDVRLNKLSISNLQNIWDTLKNEFPDDWLLPLELLEIHHQRGKKNGMSSEIETMLLLKKQKNKELNDLISNGIRLLRKPSQ